MVCLFLHLGYRYTQICTDHPVRWKPIIVIQLEGKLTLERFRSGRFYEILTEFREKLREKRVAKNAFRALFAVFLKLARQLNAGDAAALRGGVDRARACLCVFWGSF